MQNTLILREDKQRRQASAISAGGLPERLRHWQPRISNTMTAVPTREIAIDPRQPARFEKKKNMILR